MEAILAMIEELALDNLSFTGPGRGGPAYWKCRCFSRKLPDPEGWARYRTAGYEIRKWERLKAYREIEHTGGCKAVRAMDLLAKIKKGG